MQTVPDIVFLLDVDNTLLDSDTILSHLKDFLEGEFGCENSDHYWSIFEKLRKELGYADYLGALQCYRMEHSDDPRLHLISSFLINYPYKERLYPNALAVIEHLQQFGPTVILSDGDIVLQPLKILRSGLWDAVEGRVLIYVHKEQMLAAIKEQYPAKHYVMVDDKLRILAAMKAQWKNELTTIFPRQGHYAHDIKQLLTYRKADTSIDSISDLLNYGFSYKVDLIEYNLNSNKKLFYIDVY